MKRDGTLELHDVKPSSIADEMRAIVNSDEGLWFVSRYLIGNARLSERTHKPMLKWAQRMIAKPDSVLSLRDPRASGKTDGFTIALPLYAWAADPKPGTPLQSFNTCLVIVAPKKDLASNIFVANVERRFTNCKAYRELFPHLQPDPKFWSLKNGLLLRRTLVHGLPNLLPLGMESVSTSLHPPILLCDDPITEQNYRSNAEVRRVRSWVEHSHSLTAPVHGVRAFIGNYWTVGDVQDMFHPEREDCLPEWRKVNVWERGLTGCETCKDSPEKMWPGGGTTAGRQPGHIHEGARFPLALLKSKVDEEKDPDAEEDLSYIDEIASSLPSFIYLTQRENILVDPANLAIDMKWVKYYDWWYDHSGDPGIAIPVAGVESALVAGDPRYRKRAEGDIIDLRTLDRFDFYILVDPASSEESTTKNCRFAIAVVACEKSGAGMFLIDEYAENHPAHVNINAILDYYEKWRPYVRKIAYESVAYQSTIGDSLLQTAQTRGISVRKDQIIALPRLRSEGMQEDRIRHALIPIMETGNFFVRHGQRIFHEEVSQFGLKGGKHDLLDAISNIIRVRTPNRVRGPLSGNSAVKARLRRCDADSVTGY
jgi:hypothetical protein